MSVLEPFIVCIWLQGLCQFEEKMLLAEKACFQLRDKMQKMKLGKSEYAEVPQFHNSCS